MKFPNVTVCCCPGWMSWIVCVRLIVELPAVIVRWTTTPVSCELPESSTVATKLRSAETLTVVAVDVESAVPPGLAATETSASPCLPPGVPPVEAPRQARRAAAPNERALTRSLVRDDRRLRDDDAGDAHRLQLLRRRDAVELLPDDVARGEQRSPASASASVVDEVDAAFFEFHCASAFAEPGEALCAQLERVDEVLVDRRAAGPAARICCAWSYSCCSCCAYCCSSASRSACFDRGRELRRERRGRARSSSPRACARSPRTTRTRRACSCPGRRRPRRRTRRR